MNTSPRTALQPTGWRAELALQFAPRRGRTVIVARHQRGPLLVQRPFYPEPQGVCHTYLLHPPAGIVGGDDLSISLDIATHAHALVTTPAATRWYFGHRRARLQQHAQIAAGGTLEWLPQETLLFDGARAQLGTRIELSGNARFIGWEMLGFGRPACGETYRHGELDFRFEIFRDGAPLLLERLRAGDGGVPGLRGHAASATFVATGADERAVIAARAACDATAGSLSGVTRIGDLLICRAVAAHCAPLIALFHSIWSALRNLLLGCAPSAPRIWRT